MTTHGTIKWRLCELPLYSLMAADRRAGEAVAVVRILFNNNTNHANTYYYYAYTNDTVKWRLCELPLFAHGGGPPCGRGRGRGANIIQ